MTIIDYINDNIDTINGFKQDKLPRTDRGMSELEDAKKHLWFAKAVEKLSIPMSRDEVREYYNKDLYLGFLATLIWGGAHLNYREHFRKMIKNDPNEIKKKLQRVIELLKKGNSEDGKWFRSLCNKGENHINGLGPSFFTKVLYFTSHIHGNTNFLILDGKMWNAYNAFLIANKKQKRRSVSNCTFEDYTQYCKYMHSFDGVNNPEELEAFLFTHNKEVKKLLGQGNTHVTKLPVKQSPRKTKRNNKKNDNEWEAYQPFAKLEGNISGMELVKPGYCLPLNNIDGEIEHYRIFVAKHISGATKGHYFCKIEKEWGLGQGNIDDNPDAYNIFYEFTPQHKLYKKIIIKAKQKWYNSKPNKPDAKLYRYVTFDETASKEDAIAFMEDVIDHVKNTLGN